MKKGGNFAELAKKFSDDKSTAVKGGELPWISKGQTVKAFEDAAYSLKVGEISKPVLSEFGYHIIKRREHRISSPMTRLGRISSVLLMQEG